MTIKTLAVINLVVAGSLAIFAVFGFDKGDYFRATFDLLLAVSSGYSGYVNINKLKED